MPGLGISPGRLLELCAEARRLKVPAHELLLAEGDLSAEDYYRGLARRLGATFTLDIESLGSPPREPAAARAGLAVLAGSGSTVLAPRGRALLGILDLHGQSRLPGRRLIVTTPDCFSAWVRWGAGPLLADQAAHQLGRAEPGLTAAHVPSPAAGLVLAALGLAALACAIAGGVAWLALSLAISIFLSGAILVRVLACAASWGTGQAEPAPLPDAQLPHYTIVVALYHEANVVAQLLEALARIDYPAAKLDIKFILEADDAPTHAALLALHPGPACDIIIAPEGPPRTKPRALNIGLALALGELLVVYDAEDVPDPQQLRRAAATFARRGPQLGCLQCRLVIDNAGDSWLSAFFALEYAALFDVMDPGLASLGWPMPLGGTSNHFRVATLRRLRGWDAWNVTEDADIGLRLARYGYAVETLASTTAEEAPAQLGPWLAQRRRWIKGWMQTLIVHLRQPLRLAGDLGAGRMVAMLCLLGGGVLGPLLAPPYAGLFIWEVSNGDLLSPASIPDALLSTLWCSNAAIGSLALLVPTLIGAGRRGLQHLLPLLIALPFYLALLWLAAVLAALDLFRRPHHWAKTPHGLARTSLRRKWNPPVG